MDAGEIKGTSERATASKYFDWTYAQKVWFDLNTGEKFDAEWSKYSKEFEPWLSHYQRDARAAMNELDSMPKAKRLKVQRGYDMQLAFDQWFDHVYSDWYAHFPDSVGIATGRGTTAPTFDDYLAEWSQRNTCRPTTMLNECGPVPDWRTPRMRSESQAMMRQVIANATEQKARQNTKTK